MPPNLKRTNFGQSCGESLQYFSLINYLLDAKAECRPIETFEQKSKAMSKNEEIKKLRERIEALEFIKELQQDIIVELEHWTGDEFSKKSLPESLIKEMQMGGIPQKK